jgi:hypothetical protein
MTKKSRVLYDAAIEKVLDIFNELFVSILIYLFTGINQFFSNRLSGEMYKNTAFNLHTATALS